MELRINQCTTGRFNLLSNEETFSFYMGIYEDGKLITVGNDKAQIHYSGEKSEAWSYEDCFEQLEDIFPKCFEYACGVYSTTDYKANCLLFAKVYQENYEQLNEQAGVKRNEQIRKSIENLQKKLRTDALPDISYSIEQSIKKRIASLEKSVKWNESQLADLKEESDKYAEVRKRTDKINSDIAALNEVLEAA